MKLIILLVSSILVSLGQAAETKIQIQQLRFTGFTPGCFLVVLPSTEIGCVVWQVNIAAVSVPSIEFGWRLPSKPDPTTLQVFRNGVLQEMGEDYKLDGDLIVFTQAQTSVPEDKVKAHYFIKQ